MPLVVPGAACIAVAAVQHGRFIATLPPGNCPAAYSRRVALWLASVVAVARLASAGYLALLPQFRHSPHACGSGAALTGHVPMPCCAEDAVATVEQCRVDALLAGDVATLGRIIEDACTHVESGGVARTKAAFLDDVARREFSFDLSEHLDNPIRVFGDTAVVAGA